MGRKHAMLGFLVLYLVLLFVGATMQLPSSMGDIGYYDKVLHFAEFFLLSILLFFSLRVFGARRVLVSGLLLGLACALLSEAVQLFIAERSFSLLDLAADLAGLLLGMGVFSWISSKR